MRLNFIVFVSVCCFSQSALASDWYVDGKGGRDTNAGTSTAPFQTPWKGVQVAQPGDTVHLLPTAQYNHFAVIAKSGTAVAPITIKGDGISPNRTKIVSDGSDFGLEIIADANGTSSSYINIVNLDVQAPGTWSGILVGSGCHHVAVLGNYVHDSGGAGIATVRADYVTIKNNLVERNATNTSKYYESGITTWENTDVDGNVGIKMIIDGNTIRDNTNTPNSPGVLDIDGEGIIIDDLRHTQYDNRPYHGRTLITNNLIYHNGGRGVHIFASDHVALMNNTIYFNNQDPYRALTNPGEIMLLYSGDVQSYNNVSYSDAAFSSYTGSQNVVLSISYGSGGPISIDHDIGFASDKNAASYIEHNSNEVGIGSDYSWVDPLFTNPNKRKFRLQPNSPALFSADSHAAPRVDIRGRNRHLHGPTEMGAYQQY